MNEESTNVTEIKNKSKNKHSLWWLKLLFILCVFAGGTIFGLKLPTLNLPEPIAKVLFAEREYTDAISDSADDLSFENPAVKETEPPAASFPKETVKPTVVPKASSAPDNSDKTEKEEQVSDSPDLQMAEDADETDLTEETDTHVEVETFVDSVITNDNDYPEALTEADDNSKLDESEYSEIISDNTVFAENSEKSVTIGIDAALKAALDHAGFRESDAEIYGVYKETVENELVYTVEFSADSKLYYYYVNAFSGIIEGWRLSRENFIFGASSFDSYDSHEEDVLKQEPSNLPDIIEVSAAKEAAFKHAGIKETNATKIKSALELEGLNLVYEIEFRAGIYEFNYTVDAVNGSVIRWEKEIG